MILEQFYPREWLNSTYEIPWEQWQKKGIRGVIFDIDNTLVEHGAPADKRAVELFERLRGLGIKTCLLSNNKEPRVGVLCSCRTFSLIFIRQESREEKIISGRWS